MIVAQFDVQCQGIGVDDGAQPCRGRGLGWSALAGVDTGLVFQPGVGAQCVVEGVAGDWVVFAREAWARDGPGRHKCLSTEIERPLRFGQGGMQAVQQLCVV
ncbi:hypothetical protein ADL02_25000 [Streptomyces sp. NRRL WC-3723]|nr:hypothetical protein ADL02_25000 [Streptomyces sp. NRRL WC-3723]